MENNVTPKPGLNAFHLKLIAIVGMTFDHVAVAFENCLPLPVNVGFFLVGGVTFPIMAFLLSEGYQHTKNLKRYAGRLFLCGTISIVPFVAATGFYFFNIMFTLLLGLIAIYCYDNMRNRFAFWALFVGLALISGRCDWYFTGVPMILAYHALRRSPWRLFVPVVIIWLFAALPLLLLNSISPAGPLSNVLSFVLYCLTGYTEADPTQSAMIFLPDLTFYLLGGAVSSFLLSKYNGQRGRPSQRLFYVYYPLHLSLIGAAKLWLL